MPNKLLFITSRDPVNCSLRTGGLLLSFINFELLKKKYEVDLLAVYPDTTTGLNSKLQKLFQLFQLFLGWHHFLTPKKKSEVVQAATRYDVVFIDYSLYGSLAKTIRKAKPSVKIITHFHNIEYVFAKTSANLPKPLRLIQAWLVKREEQIAARHSNHLIFLSKEDATFYPSASKTHIVSPSTIDLYQSPYPSEKMSAQPRLLFCGSYFKPNVTGISWFIEKVLPDVDATLTVIGAGMERLKQKYPQSGKLNIVGTVADVKPFYRECDIVISPIFEGAGMKMKSIEALMFNRPLVASPLALIGIPNQSKYILTCKSSQEFVAAITKLAGESIPSNSVSPRAIFEKSFTVDVRGRQLLEAIES